ncbi:GDP-Mannose:GMP Antiporter (GMA) Family [Pseudoloma neurophilia]|uniref:GDP-Mannose:GMP Antiporter (GMA) Family n=1 Tax=Pseudoloma neurophilia TaxID=146866 RepID=A0A0R0M1C2_9MICR|nr:GDP-Mannose:GMP Antiporter (GMA) Family [Pseudoloma neurophilia]
MFTRKTAFKHLLIPIYLISSLLSTFLNKQIAIDFNLSFFVLFLQSAIVAIFLVILRCFKLIKFRIESKFLLLWTPATICLVLMIFTGLKALGTASISIFTLFKNNTLILIALAEKYLFNRQISKMSSLSFFLMIVSSLFMSHKDTFNSLNWLILNVFISGMYVLILRWSFIQYTIEKNKIPINITKISKNKPHSVIVFSERTEKPSRISISDLKKKFENVPSENTPSEYSNETDEIYLRAQNTEITHSQSDFDFAALAYTQILSMPFLFILSSIFDNYMADPIFKKRFDEDFRPSPDFIDTFIFSLISKGKNGFVKQILENILLIKAFTLDILDPTTSFLTEKTLILIILSSISVFFVALSSIKILSGYSSTTLSMLGAINKVLLSLTGISSDFYEISGIVIGCLASVLYTDTLRKE